MACVALLLLPVLDAEVPAHVAEAAALLLLGNVWRDRPGQRDRSAAGGRRPGNAGAELGHAGRPGRRRASARSGVQVFRAGRDLAGRAAVRPRADLPGHRRRSPSRARSRSPAIRWFWPGVVMVGMGFAFELALFPFHWGALDAYTAAAPSLAGFVMSASKLAAAFALGRLVLGAGVELGQLLIWVGSLTIVWGTVRRVRAGADLRRMLAYSAITHAGFIGLALGSGPNGPATAAFYAAMYAQHGHAGVRRAGRHAAVPSFDARPLAGAGARPGAVLAERHSADAGLLGQAGRAGRRLAGGGPAADADRRRGRRLQRAVLPAAAARPVRRDARRRAAPRAGLPVPGVVVATVAGGRYSGWRRAWPGRSLTPPELDVAYRRYHAGLRCA